MCDFVCVTNRKLCQQDFLTQLKKVLSLHPKALLLREKVLPLCRAAGVPCIFHNFPHAAEMLPADGLHLPLVLLEQLPAAERKKWKILGASCHSLEDVQKAAKLGVSYVTYGHVYATSCKPGLPPRGVEKLRDICKKSPVPVYAIGGITPDKWPELQKAGAAGACLMSWFMKL